MAREHLAAEDAIDALLRAIGQKINLSHLFLHRITKTYVLTVLCLTFLSCSSSESIKSPAKMFNMDDGGQYVSFTGRWYATAQPGFIAVSKINTVEVRCPKPDMVCTETLAHLMTPHDSR
jgi:hypothetical protein